MSNEQKGKTDWTFIGSVCLGVLVFLVLNFFFVKSISGWGIFGLIGILVFDPLALFPVVYFVLAPRNMFFTFVHEGQVKMVMRGGKFRKALIQWKNHKLDRDGKVVDGEDYHLLGGLRFYGLWPLDQIYKYKFEWTGLKPDGSPLHHPPEILDYVLLKQDVYFGTVKDAEDKDLLPLNVGFVLTLQTTNPYQALFSVQNWLEAIISRTIPVIRKEMAADSYEKLIAQTEAMSKGVNSCLEDSGLKESFKNQYGTTVLAIQIQTIDPPETHRAATLKLFEAQQEAKRITTLAEADATAYETRKEALGGGDKGLDNLMTLEVVKGVKSTDKIVIENLRKIGSTIFSGKP